MKYKAALFTLLFFQLIHFANGSLTDEERKGRAMDQLALTAKKKSVSTMLQIAKTKRGTPDEPNLLVRAAEGLQGCASIEFRLAHSRAQESRTAVRLNEYRQYLSESIVHLTRVIQHYKDSPVAPRAYYLRAKAKKEFNEYKDAIADLRYLVDRHPNESDTQLATLLLSDLLMDQKDYKSAIFYLNQLSARGGSTYLLALDRLALAHFSLNDIQTALKYIQLEFVHFNKQDPGTPGSSINREKAMLNAALYYSSGVEKKIPGYDVASAIKFFKSLDKGPALIKAIVYFANLLRTKGADEELEQLKNLALKGELNAWESAVLVSEVLDNQVNKRRYGQMRQTIEELDMLIGKVSEESSSNINQDKFDKIKKSLGQAVSRVQAEFQATKNKSENPLIASTLIALYNYTLKSAGNDRTLKFKTSYNIAETYYLLSDFKSASKYYRYVAEDVTARSPEEKKIVDEAKFKMIASRYEELKAQKVFPKDLKATTMAKADKKDLPVEATEWFTWLDRYRNTFKTKPTMDMMQFEATRLLYSFGHIDAALSRIREYIKTYPEVEYSVASASLYIDTYVSAEDWKNTYDIALEFMKQTKWKDPKFHDRLNDIASDAYFKMIEDLYRKKDYVNTIKYVEDFSKYFPKSKNVGNAYALAANSYLATGDKKSALVWFDKLNKSGASTSTSINVKSTSMLTSATVAEDAYDYAAASNVYKNYILSPDSKSASKSDLKDLRKKVILMSWLSGNKEEIQSVMSNSSLCKPDFERECGRYSLYATLMFDNSKLDQKEFKKYYYRAVRGEEEQRIIYATILLKRPELLSYEERHALLNIVNNNWGKMDPIEAYTLLPYLNTSIPQSLILSRKFVKESARLKVDQKYIQKRVKMMEDYESYVNKLFNLPWSNMRVSALNELANMYNDFSNELVALPKPAGMSAEDNAQYDKMVNDIRTPFITKRDDLRFKAYDLATKSFVDQTTFYQVASYYFNEKPDVWSKVSRGRTVQKDGLPASALTPVMTITKWPLTSSDNDHEKEKGIRIALEEASKKKNWPKIAFLISEAKSKGLMSEPMLRVVKGNSFALAGARAEAITEFTAAKETFSGDLQIRAMIPVIIAHYETFDYENTKELMEEFAEMQGHRRNGNGMNPTLANVLVQANQWSKAKTPSNFADQISKVARGESVGGDE